MANLEIVTCENCGQEIGRLETPMVWRDNIVCPECYSRLCPPLAAPVAEAKAGMGAVVADARKHVVLSLFTIFAWLFAALALVVILGPDASGVVALVTVPGAMCAVIGAVRDGSRGRSLRWTWIVALIFLAANVAANATPKRGVALRPAPGGLPAGGEPRAGSPLRGVAQGPALTDREVRTKRIVGRAYKATLNFIKVAHEAGQPDEGFVAEILSRVQPNGRPWPGWGAMDTLMFGSGIGFSMETQEAYLTWKKAMLRMEATGVHVSWFADPKRYLVGKNP